MKEVKTIVLEDGIEYYVVDEIDYNATTYYYLANMNDEKDICVRKKLVEDNTEYMTMLDSVDELRQVLDVFERKHQS